MFDELITVTLTHNISEYGLSSGDVGTVVHVYNDGEAYEVEFTDSLGETIAVLTLTPSDITAFNTNPTVKWVEPIWGGIQLTPYIESDSKGTKTKMFFSQL